jgi:DNA-directed RNA polymerase subunit RPC12/RpoP
MSVGDTFDELAEDEATIECRSCNNQMPVDESNCPHCGSRAITRVESGLLAAGGLAVAVGTGLIGLWPIAAVGAVAVIAGVAMYRNRSQKIERAKA